MASKTTPAGDIRTDAPWVAAPAHPQEPARLEELQALDLVHLADGDLKQFTRLAANCLNVPMAHIGLPEDDTNWIKARVGLDAASCDRAVSFCGHAIHEPDMLVVSDTHADSRFAGHPLVLGDPDIRFYAGAVFRGRSGEPLGTICVIDQEPRAFTDHDRRLLSHIRDEVQARILDYADRRDRHTQLVRAAMTDPLTGLPSTRIFRDRLEHAVTWAHADEERFGILLADIAGFRDIRRARGQELAEGVLKAVAERLIEAISADFTVARWTEDVFAVITPTVDSVIDLENTARSILAAFSGPLKVANQNIPVRLRIGVSRYPEDGAQPDALIDAAGQAIEQMYREGRTGFATPDASLNRQIAERLDLEHRLVRALDEDRLSVFYQPKISIRQERLIDAEALARWHEPDIGWISPARFIPVAEQSGLIHKVGSYVLRAACREAATWPELSNQPAKVAVNVSTQQLQDAGFTETLRSALADTGLPAACLTLEVTESELVGDMETVVSNMRAITDLGVTFAVDDFGTGHASFDYLRRLPIASLKMDKRFIDQITDEHADARICNAMIALGHALGLAVVAEGVETHEQALFLRAYGCDQLQGFHFSKPLSGEDFRAYVDTLNGRSRSLKS